MRAILLVILTLIGLPGAIHCQYVYNPPINDSTNVRNTTVREPYHSVLKRMADAKIENSAKAAYKTADIYLKDTTLFKDGKFLPIVESYNCQGRDPELTIYNTISDIAIVHHLETQKANSTFTNAELNYLKHLAIDGFKYMIDSAYQAVIKNNVETKRWCSPSTRWRIINQLGSACLVLFAYGYVDMNYPDYEAWANWYWTGNGIDFNGGSNGMDAAISNFYSLFGIMGIDHRTSLRIKHTRSPKSNSKFKVKNGLKWFYLYTKKIYGYASERYKINGPTLGKPAQGNTGNGLVADYTYFSHGPVNMNNSYGSVLRTKCNLLFPAVAPIDYTSPYALKTLSKSEIESYKRTKLKAIPIIYKHVFFANAIGSTFNLKGRGYTRATSPRWTPYTLSDIRPPTPFEPTPLLTFLESVNADIRNRPPLTKEELIGKLINRVRSFPDGDVLVKTKRNYTIAVYGASKYLKAAESFQSSNRKSAKLGRGTYSLNGYGKEYKNLQPIFNWDLLPGATSTYTNFGDNGAYGNPKSGSSYFNGGLDDGLNMGIHGVYDDYRCIAKKGYFMFDKDDIMICLGSGIHHPSNNGGANDKKIATSVQQMSSTMNIAYKLYSKDPIVINEKSTTDIDGNLEWIYHYGVGYFNMDTSSKFTIFNDEKSGTWRAISNESTKAANSDGPNKGIVFGAYIKHHKATKSNPAKYAYAIAMDMPSIQSLSNIDISNYIYTNTTKIHAVRSIKDKTIQLIFWEPSTYIDPVLSNSLRIQVDEPCYMMIKNYDSDSATLLYADPTEYFRTGHRTVNLLLPHMVPKYGHSLQPVMINGIPYSTKDFEGKRTITIKALIKDQLITANPSVKTHKKSLEVNVFPNPTQSNHSCTLLVKGLDKGVKINWELSSLNGLKIHEGTIRNGQILPLPSLLPSTYVLRVNFKGQTGVSKWRVED